jgi:hypothetical protein
MGGVGAVGNEPDERADASAEVSRADFLDLCRRLNEAGVRYLVYGGFACILHGRIRTTCDVDLFLGDDRDNIGKALQALSAWGDGFARELTAEDLFEYCVVRVVDRFTVDLAARVWKLDWNEAWNARRIVTIDDTDIPVLSRRHLLLSKETVREQDALDRMFLAGLSTREPGRAAEPGQDG